MLDYLKRTRRVTPALEQKAMNYLSLGYQRLLSFECRDGGFEWWGQGTGIVFLSAYGLQEFHEMSRVLDIDPKVVERTRRFLLSRMSAEGSWSLDGCPHGARVEALSPDQQKLGLTAYVLWSLLAAETPGNDPHVQQGLAWLRDAAETRDPYLQALAALALLSADRTDRRAHAILDELIRGRVQEGSLVHWTGGTSVISYAAGNALDVETTATVVLALQKANRNLDVASQALGWIVTRKDADGTWLSTQATILALKALLGAAAGTAGTSGTALVRVNGREVARVPVTPEDSDLMRQIEARELVRTGDNVVEIEWDGAPGMMGQVVGRWHVPWSEAASAAGAALALDVVYDRTRVARDERIACTVRATNRQDQASRMVMVCVGTPPGFTVDTGELESLVAARKVAKFEQNGREVVLYLDRLGAKETVELRWHLQARFAVQARSARSRIYEYYAPEVQWVAPPQEFVVE